MVDGSKTLGMILSDLPLACSVFNSHLAKKELFQVNQGQLSFIISGKIRTTQCHSEHFKMQSFVKGYILVCHFGLLQHANYHNVAPRLKEMKGKGEQQNVRNSDVFRE